MISPFLIWIARVTAPTRHDDAVYPEGDIYINKTCAVNRTCMSVQQVELLQEEVHSEHQVEYDAENDELAAGDVHQVLYITIINVGIVASLLLSVRIKRCLYSFLARSSHSADHGVVDRCAVDDFWLCVLFLFFEFRLRRQIIVFIIEDVRGPDRKQEHIVDNRDYHKADDRNKNDLVYFIKPVQIEDIETDIQIEKRILQAELRRILRLEECKPCACGRVHSDSEAEYYREYPRSGVYPL